MKKQEPAWKAEGASAIADALKAAAYECDGDCGLSEDACWEAHPVNWFATVNHITHVHGAAPSIATVAMEALAPHVKAAEQRGFQAGVNKTGDSVGKLREQLKTARADAFREAAEKIRRGWDETRGATQASKVMEFAACLIDPDQA